MSYEILKERVDRLREVHLQSIASYYAYEGIQVYRATNLHGEELANKHAEAIGVYKGFFNSAEKALNVNLHLSVAKLFDSHKDALHIEKLLRYTESNQSKLIVEQESDLEGEKEYTAELAKVYAGLDLDDLLEIKADLELAENKIKRLKDIRDQEVAHNNLIKPEKLEYLTYQEFVELIDLSEKILNLISGKIYGDTAYFDPFKKQTIEDTNSLLKLVGKSNRIIEYNTSRSFSALD